MNIEKAKERIISARKSVRLQHLGWGKIFEQEIAQALSELSQPECKTCKDTGIVIEKFYSRPLFGGIMKANGEFEKKIPCPDCSQPEQQSGEPAEQPEPSEFTKKLRAKLSPEIARVQLCIDRDTEKRDKTKSEANKEVFQISIDAFAKELNLLIDCAESCDIIDRLEAALKKYGVHTADCAVRYERDRDCNCGYDEAKRDTNARKTSGNNNRKT